MPAPWFVWTGSVRAQGQFPTFEAALTHCRTLTNDHRRKYELEQGPAGAHRYVGPRGRRHGARLVAWIFNPAGGDALGIDIGRVYGDVSKVW